MTLESRQERANQFLLDAATAIPLDPNELILRHTRALAAVRALWVSRRKWRAVAADLAKQLGDVRALHSGAEHWITELEDLHRPSGVLALHRRANELEAERERLRTQLSAKLSTLRASSTRKGLEYKNPVRHGYDLALVDALALLGVDATERDRSAEPAPAVDSETELGLLLAQKREGGDR